MTKFCEDEEMLLELLCQCLEVLEKFEEKKQVYLNNIANLPRSLQLKIHSEVQRRIGVLLDDNSSMVV